MDKNEVPMEVVRQQLYENLKGCQEGVAYILKTINEINNKLDRWMDRLDARHAEWERERLSWTGFEEHSDSTPP